MGTAYGIAAVTATLRELLNDGIVEHNLNGILSSLVGVSAVPPDRVIPASGVEPGIKPAASASERPTDPTPQPDAVRLSV